MKRSVVRHSFVARAPAQRMAVLFLLWSVAAVARGAVDPTASPDYPRRAAAALYNTKAGPDAPQLTFDKIDEKALGGINISAEAATGPSTRPARKMYALQFGGVEDGVDTQGIYEVAVNAAPLDWTTRGFKKLAPDKDTGGEVYHRPPPAGVKYQTVRVRKTLGKVTLSVAQRRPADEPAAQAVQKICQRFARLLDQARKNKLLAGEIRVLLTSFSAEPNVGDVSRFRFSLDDAKPTTLSLRIDTYDAEGMPVTDVKSLSILFAGELADEARLRVGGAVVQPTGKPHVIDDPGLAPTVQVEFPAPESVQILTRLFGGTGWVSEGLVLEIAADVDGDNADDVSTYAPLDPIAWRPIVSEFFAAAGDGNATVVPPPPATQPTPGDLSGEFIDWMRLQPFIAARKTAYDKAGDVTCAWVRTINGDGTIQIVSYSHEPGTPPGPPHIHTIHNPTSIALSVGLDATMNAMPEGRNELVRQHFKVLELAVTATRVSDDPAKFQEAVPADAKPVAVLTVGSAGEGAGQDLSTLARKYVLDGGAAVDWSPTIAGKGPGVFEFRIKARVSGRVNEIEEPVIKTAEGVIRVAVTDKEDRQVTVIPVRKYP
jgi:hypothetical protein